MTAEAEQQKAGPLTPVPEPKQQAQAKLVNRFMHVLSTTTTLTAVEVLGALEIVRLHVGMQAMVQPSPQQPKSQIITPHFNGGAQ